jgi:histidine triad (HIT) family protein
MKNDCIFCAIAAHDVPSTFVHEDDAVIAIRDLNPQAPVHVLVMPREHITSAAELNHDRAELWYRLLRVAKHIAAAEGVAESGYRLVVNTGKGGGQTVGHLHLHILGGRQMTWPPG